MAVGFSSYQIARSGLTVSERGLYVTGHNLSNVNTPGYTRQQLMIESSPYYTTYTKTGLQQLGLGADIQETRQIRHTFLDTIYRNENMSLGYWQSRSKALEDIQAILGDPMGAGIQNTMNQFWDSWQELSKEPDSLTARALVRQRSEALIYQFNQIGTQIDRLQSDLNEEIRVRITDLNSITKDIAKLNNQIMSQEINGDAANDFRDQRNYLLDKLSSLCDAQVYEGQDGQVEITLGGYFLVSKSTSTELYVEANATNGLFYTPMLAGTDIVVPIKSGTIKGLLEARGEVSGIKGSYENGSPREKADITLAIDTSVGSGSGASEYLSKLKASMETYIDDLKKSGMDFNIRIVTMNNTSSVFNGKVYSSSDIDSLLTDAGFDSLFNESSDAAASMGGFISALEDINAVNGFRADATKMAVMFTNKSIDGDVGSPLTDATAYIERLNALGVKTSVVTSEIYYEQGESSTEPGWEEITKKTGGKLFDIDKDADSFGNLVISTNRELNRQLNAVMSNIQTSNNIVSDIRTKLNAMVNSFVREINYIHQNGYTLDGKEGSVFFEPIDDKYPMELGNIRLSDSLLSDKGLNNIVAGATNAKGDNSIALKIANLRSSDILEDNTGEVSIDTYYRSLILDIGNRGQLANTTTNSQTNLVNAANNQRTSISGVSMDEEMANMMKFKYSYSASSRCLNVIDQMIETVILKMGLAGR